MNLVSKRLTLSWFPGSQPILPFIAILSHGCPSSGTNGAFSLLLTSSRSPSQYLNSHERSEDCKEEEDVRIPFTHLGGFDN